MLAIGKKLDQRYVIQKKIGSGGFGAVYLAEDTRFSGQNLVAIKQVTLQEDSFENSFKREADLLYNLSHLNLPNVTDYFQEDGIYFLVMDYISGDDLAQGILQKQRLKVDEVLAVADKVLDALNYLHTNSVFHRDIKPHNIKIDENGEVFLLDFGMAKGGVDEESIRPTGLSVTGYTPFYAPIEQVLRVDAQSYFLLREVDEERLEKYSEMKTDARSDLYSLGATLYHLLTHSSPEKATSPIRANAVWAGKQDTLPPIQSLNPNVSKNLAIVLHKSLALDPDDRFQTAKDFHESLRSATTKASDYPLIDNASFINETYLLEETRTSPEFGDLPEVNTKPRQITVDSISDSMDSFSLDFNKENKEEVPAKVERQKSYTPIYIGLLGVIAILILGSGLFAYWLFLPKPNEPEAAQELTKVSTSGEGKSVESNDDSTVEKTVRNLDYLLMVQKMRDGKKFQEPFESSGQEIFETGYQFQMRFTPSESGYLYVFNEGLNDKGETSYHIIFPTPIRNSGSAIVTSNTKYESGWNEFTGTAGTENFWIIWSKNSSELLEKAHKNAFDSDGGELVSNELKQNLKNFLEKNSKNDKETYKDYKQYSQLKFEGDSAVHLIKLEYR